MGDLVRGPRDFANGIRAWCKNSALCPPPLENKGLAGAEYRGRMKAGFLSLTRRLLWYKEACR